jgi:hypothetical protein
MPVQTDVGDMSLNSLYSAQNQAQFSKLAVYFALNQIERIPQLEVYSKMFGDIPWQSNMGTTLQGLRVEPTPKVRGDFRPNAVTTRANVDIFDQREYKEQAVVYWHKVQSPLIYFLRNWQDFISNQVQPAVNDINEQVVYLNEMFIRTGMWDRAPFLYVCGANGPYTPMPHNGVVGGVGANPKTQQVLQQLFGATTPDALTLPAIHNALVTLQVDAGAAPISNPASALPKENDLLRGNYVLVTSSEAYGQLIWDTAFQRIRSINDNYVNNRFMDHLFGQLAVKGEQYPLRFDVNGNVVAPEVVDEPSGETVPNPNYASPAIALYEVAWIMGGSCYRSVRIGPPPKDFSGGVSAKQANGMNWNGKVYITDKILIRDGAAPNNIEYNSYGEYLRIQGTITMGLLAGRPRSCIPIIFQRRRTSELSAT